MYPDNFSNYSLEDLLQLLDHLNQTGGIYNGSLSVFQKRSLLAKLASVRADLDQTVQHLDETIQILSEGWNLTTSIFFQLDIT